MSPIFLELSAITLTAWLQTLHPTMPNIVMTDAEMRNVIQYILSLKNDLSGISSPRFS